MAQRVVLRKNFLAENKVYVDMAENVLQSALEKFDIDIDPEEYKAVLITMSITLKDEIGEFIQDNMQDIINGRWL